MISTRDFILFVVVLIFLLGGIFYTWTQHGRVAQIDFVAEEREYTVATEQNAPYDTAARLATLQQKISAGEGLIESAPANFRSIDQLRAEAAAEAARIAAEEAAKRAAENPVNICGQLSQNIFWSGVNDITFESGRVQFLTEMTMGTSTEIKTLFSLPQRTVRSSFDSCIDNTIIGATSDGRPLANTAGNQYVGFSSSVALGYTRDGFRIYGPVANPETLDKCGGRYEGGEYRYHARVGYPTLISCFAGTPEPILLNQ